MQPRRTAWLGALLLTLAVGSTLRADYASQTFVFDQSSALPSGTPYGQVTIEAYDGVGNAGGNLSAGQVRLTFTADPVPLYGPTDHFGFRAVGFNSDLALQPEQIHLPDGYALANNRHLGGFGLFRWEAQADRDHAQTPLVVTIDGLNGDAGLNHFLLASASSTGGTPRDGSVYFAGRIGGFDLNNDAYDLRSHVVGNAVPPPPSGGGDESHPPENPSPEPASLLLGLVGLGALGLRRWRAAR